MSREIMFRIWDDSNKEWFGKSDDDSLTFYGFHLAGEVMSVQCPPQWALDPWCIVEQYTGLKDKNGKEIYEGDIVKDGEAEMYNQVVWSSQVGGFRVAPSRRAVAFLEERAPEYLTKGEVVGWFITDDLEVIGNIHENPELLGGEE